MNKKKEAEFNRVYQMDFEYFVRYFTKHTSNAEVALDLTQNLFLKVWKAYQTRDIPQLERYARCCLKNTLVDWYRSNDSKYRYYSIERISEEDPTFQPESKETRYEHNEKLIKQVLESIPKSRVLNVHERTVLYLRLAEGLKDPQVAGIMDTTTGAVAVMVSRSLKKLKEEFHFD